MTDKCTESFFLLLLLFMTFQYPSVRETGIRQCLAICRLSISL